MLIIPVWYRLSIKTTNCNRYRREPERQDFYYMPINQLWWTYGREMKDCIVPVSLRMENEIDSPNGLTNSVTEIMDKYANTFSLLTPVRYVNRLLLAGVDNTREDIRISWTMQTAGANCTFWWPDYTVDPKKNVAIRSLCEGRTYLHNQEVIKVCLTDSIHRSHGGCVGAEGIVKYKDCLMWKRAVLVRTEENPQRYALHICQWVFHRLPNRDNPVPAPRPSHYYLGDVHGEKLKPLQTMEAAIKSGFLMETNAGFYELLAGEFV